ncbi:hypothetical protein [Polynucleobacter necessarius]|uniref:hypothetical protein n=1 Tax=Polynucleobacter necessarius TaxID=576610 RepID=UPI0013B04EE6|nr:hypothetical protein [Polynucleobacter necessarius]
MDGAIGSVAVHVDTAINYLRHSWWPHAISGGNPLAAGQSPPEGNGGNNYTGKLPNSYSNQNNFGFGVSDIGQAGYTVGIHRATK